MCYIRHTRLSFWSIPGTGRRPLLIGPTPHLLHCSQTFHDHSSQRFRRRGLFGLTYALEHESGSDSTSLQPLLWMENVTQTSLAKSHLEVESVLTLSPGNQLFALAAAPSWWRQVVQDVFPSNWVAFIISFPDPTYFLSQVHTHFRLQSVLSFIPLSQSLFQVPYITFHLLFQISQFIILLLQLFFQF